MIMFLWTLATWFSIAKVLGFLANKKWAFWVGYHTVIFIAAIKVVESLTK